MPREYAARLPEWFVQGVRGMQSGHPVPATTQENVGLNTLAPDWQFLDASDQPMAADRPVSDVHAFGRPDKGFFRVEAGKVPWGQPYIRELPDSNDPEGCVGVGVMLVDVQTGRLLVNFRKGPFGFELGPSVQGSFTNIRRQADNIPFVTLLQDPSQYKFISEFNPDRVLGPVRLGVEGVNGSEIDLTGKEDKYAWFSLEEIDQMALDSIPANAFFDGALKLARAMMPDRRLSQEAEEQLRQELAATRHALQEAQTQAAVSSAPQESVHQMPQFIGQAPVIHQSKQPKGLLARFFSWFGKLFS